MQVTIGVPAARPKRIAAPVAVTISLAIPALQVGPINKETDQVNQFLLFLAATMRLTHGKHSFPAFLNCAGT